MYNYEFVQHRASEAEVVVVVGYDGRPPGLWRRQKHAATDTTAAASSSSSSSPRLDNHGDRGDVRPGRDGGDGALRERGDYVKDTRAMHW